MIFDTHMHTTFSTDSKMTINEALTKSQSLGIGICFTEHLDLIYPNENEFRVDIPNYFKEYDNYRSDSLLLGIEIGLNLPINNDNSRIATSNDFDYIIGSIHAVNEEDIYLSYGKNNLNKKDYFNKYLEYMYSCLNDYSDFDSLGHIDYPCRYCPFDNKELIYSEHADFIDEILKILIRNNKVLELNTARINNKSSFFALLDIYKRYKELGGKYITLGSDAHSSKDIARNFNEALDFMDRLSLEGIYFKNRKPELITNKKAF